MPPRKTPTKKQKPPKLDPKDLEIMQLTSKVDGLSNLLGNAMAEIQKLDHKVNENWTKFFFHDHRRIDTSGPQYYSQEFEQSYLKEEERRKAMQQPPAPPVPPEKEPKSDKK